MLRPRCIACKQLVTGCLALLALLALLPAALGSAAQEAGSSSAPQGVCGSGPYRDFDFWVGEWTVIAPDGETAGHNTISREQDGCVLVERWTSASGSTGTSLNFHDPARGAWRQVWVSPGLEIDISGGLVDGSMALEGTAVYLEDGRSRRFRGVWTPLEDGRVRQFFEEQNDAGEWAPWFEGFYQRVEPFPGAP